MGEAQHPGIGADRPGGVLFTLVNPAARSVLESRCRAMGLPAIAPLDSVNEALRYVPGESDSGMFGEP